MLEAPPIDLGRLAQDLQFKRKQVESVVELLDAGNTVPFITRYRKEQTGNLDEEQIRAIQHRIHQLRQLAERRQTILRTIESQGKLTEELAASILAAATPKRLEDLYQPYKPKKQTLATIARDRGLGPLADAIWAREPLTENLGELLPGLVDPDRHLKTVEDVLTGVQHILAERIADDADVREAARRVVWQGKIQSSRAPTPAAPETPLFESSSAGAARPRDAEFRNYFDFSESLEQIPPHRILALNRGEHLGVLKVRLEHSRERLIEAVFSKLPLEGHANRELLERSAVDAIDRLLLRSLEREVRGELANIAEQHAVHVFARNLRCLLLQPPVRDKRVFAIDPGYKTGCKWAALDEFGNLLGHGVVFPHASRKKKKKKPAAGASRAAEAPDGAPAAPAPSEPTAAEPAGSPPGDDIPAAQAAPVASGAETPPLGPPPDARSSNEASRSSEIDSSAAADPTDASAAPSTADPNAAAAAPPPESGEDPAVLPADSYKRETDESDEPIGSLDEPPPDPDDAAAGEADEPSSGSDDEEIRQPRAEATFAEPPSPALAGIVVPPPGLFAEDPPLVRTSRERPPKTPAPVQLSRRERSKQILKEAWKNHKIDVVAIGNGTACRETEELVSELLAEEPNDIAYVIVNEAGASVYSASPIGREEFPEFDATLRGTISIGRRLLDPLSELVKIDPQNIGVGLYQHDVDPRLLKESLSEVVESCVNFVGVDLNTASAPLLQYVSGMNQSRARNVVEYRKSNGPFRNLEQLKDVPGVGPAVFTQAAGFLRITGGEQPLDGTWIHPENYELATRLLELLGYTSSVLENRSESENLRTKLATLEPEKTAEDLQIGLLTLQDVLADLARPGRDPREDLPKPIFRKGVLRLEDLADGMQLQGTVLNVVDFGVFVDIGLKDSGLVHISELANRYVRSPHDLLAVGDVVTCWVLAVDKERRRVSLTMIAPGTARSAHGRPPKGKRRGGAPSEQARSERGRRSSTDGRPASGPGEQPPQGEASQKAPHAAESGAEPRGRSQSSDRGGGGRPAGQGRPGGRPPGRGGPGGRPPGAHGGARRGRRNASREIYVGGSKPRSEPPPVKLSDAALEGKEVLHTFGELKALFEAKKRTGDKDKKEPT